MAEENIPVLIESIKCYSVKDHIDDCSYYYSPSKQYCSHSNVLSLFCLPCNLDFVHGSVTAFNGTNLTITCDDRYEPEQTYIQCFENGTVFYEDVCTSKYSYPLNITDISGARSRIDIMVKGEWGTICYDGFDSNDATVICKMFGLNYRSFARYWYGSGIIFIDNLKCNGSESHINECNYTVFNSCTRRYVAGVFCTDNPLNISGIRLVNGIGLSDGRVEILINDTWGTICSSSFGSYEANAICSILGYTGYTAYYTNANTYGEGTGPIFVNELDCPYQAIDFNNCTYVVDSLCSHYSDVAVVCTNTPFNITDIRLVNGTGPYDGRVELLTEDVWGAVCSRYIGQEEASTLCHMMNQR
ncbi:deleted in malignant brain tumors 1 protein-like [Mercenaria mercenaria]|uniref:deleted in malignant brain tumors 1 protein-like n=1 Tax=Mercenaria mercenaria TaxID=6596 RepID=UPI00234F153F|nr:deleted in malignant brain tumors 1 protein-like [Mercenaria mercenaria]